MFCILFSHLFKRVLQAMSTSSNLKVLLQILYLGIAKANFHVYVYTYTSRVIYKRPRKGCARRSVRNSWDRLVEAKTSSVLSVLRWLPRRTHVSRAAKINVKLKLENIRRSAAQCRDYIYFFAVTSENCIEQKWGTQFFSKNVKNQDQNVNFYVFIPFLLRVI